MNPVSYLREKGLAQALKVIWMFKLPKLQVELVSILTRRRPLEDKIVIESHNDFDCNGGALYDWLLSNGFNREIKIVWRLYHKLDRTLPENVEAVSVYGPSWRKAWHICTARWLTADCTVADKVRDDQVSLYMGHGMFSLKEGIGLIDLPESLDAVLSPSPALDGYTRKEYSISEKRRTVLLHLGYPVLDRLYEQRYSAGYRGVRPSETKTFLWMPTFRKGIAFGRDDAEGDYPFGCPLLHAIDDLKRLSEELSDMGARLIIKLHPKQDLGCISEVSFPNIEFITGESIRKMPCDNYDLMLDSDALISDYSGAAYEYAILDKPIGHIFSDIGDYRLGLIDDYRNYLVGEVIVDFSGLVDFMHAVCTGVDEGAGCRSEFVKRYYSNRDGGSSFRVARWLGISERGRETLG